jgi:hypothetical protein
VGERPATEDRTQAGKHPWTIATKVLPPRSSPACSSLHSGLEGAPILVSARARSEHGDQYILSPSWQASLKARNGSANPFLIASSMTLGKTAREFDLALHKYSPASEFPAPVQSLQFDLLPCPALFLRLTLLGYPGCGPPTNVSTSAARADM